MHHFYQLVLTSRISHNLGTICSTSFSNIPHILALAIGRYDFKVTAIRHCDLNSLSLEMLEYLPNRRFVQVSFKQNL